MAYYICHASIDEHGKISGGAAGDQTGKEVCVREWYNKAFGCVLRHSDRKIAKKARNIAIKLANSNLVGYDQAGRNTLYKTLEKYGFDVDKYIASGIKTEVDCSSFMTICYICAGVTGLKYTVNAPTTSTMITTFKKNGFIDYTDGAHTTSCLKAEEGDVYVKPGAHTIMYIGTNSKVEEDAPKTTKNNSVAKDTKDSKEKFYKACSKKCITLIEGLKDIGVDSSYSNRAKIAVTNDIKNYSGTAVQNIQMLSLLKQGKLKKG